MGTTLRGATPDTLRGATPDTLRGATPDTLRGATPEFLLQYLSMYLYLHKTSFQVLLNPISAFSAPWSLMLAASYTMSYFCWAKLILI
jgi:hypothetical protein